MRPIGKKVADGYEFYKANSLEIGITFRGSVIFTEEINRINIRDNLVFSKVDKLPPEIQKSWQGIQTNETEAPSHFADEPR
ncbi:hypothetical protein, partial [Leptolyngbya sp. FACHB-711]|uniref:hypothetical protein n=1 Tax=Leptolyngbya sp. FACHB-711 TaxID=2692813 RepID=UPI001A7EB515